MRLAKHARVLKLELILPSEKSGSSTTERIPAGTVLLTVKSSKKAESLFSLSLTIDLAHLRQAKDNIFQCQRNGVSLRSVSTNVTKALWMRGKGHERCKFNNESHL